MKRNYNNIFILLAGFIFVASISSDPLIHDHLHDEHLVECALCENKAFPALKSMRPEVLNTVLPTVVVIAQFSSSLELNVFVSCGFVIEISPYLNVEKYYAGMVLLAMIIVKPS